MSQNKFLIVKSKAGFGNRILNTLGSILYAKISDRKLIIDWSDKIYSHDGNNVFSKLFTIPDLNLETEIPNTDSVYPLIWKDNLNKSINDVLRSQNEDSPKIYRNPLLWSKYRIDTKKIDYPHDCLVTWYYSAEIDKLRRHFKGEFSSLKFLNNEAILKSILRKYLLLNETIHKRVSNFKYEYFGDITIGVHIRYTDRKSPLEKYPIIIDKILSKHPKARIFLATDNQLVEKIFQEKYGSVLIVTDKWFPKNSQGVQRLHENWDSPDRLESGIQSLVDMYLLAASNYLICDQRSTLAFVAKLISDIPEANIFDLSRYSIKKNMQTLIQRMDRYF